MKKIAYSTVYYEEVEDIGCIVINSPPGNLTTGTFIDEFIRLSRGIFSSCKPRGLIIRGNGRHFSSGADVDELIQRMTAMTVYSEHEILSYPKWFVDNRTALDSLYNSDIPVISCVNGFCIGSGLEYALIGHIRICGKKSTVGFPESTFGLLPGATGTLRGLEEMGLAKSIEMILSGELIHAEEAVACNLFHKAINKKDLDEYTTGLMSYILAKEEKYEKHRVMKYINEFEEVCWQKGENIK